MHHGTANSVGLLLPVRDRRRPWRHGSADFVPPYDAYGCFLVVGRPEFERVNGFDARFEGWGTKMSTLPSGSATPGCAAAGRAPAPRCSISGIRSARPHTASLNAKLLGETRDSGRIEAVEGLRELAAEC